jgi:hypothetical protein
MGKIRLEVDALRVESFDTAAVDAKQRGTVRAHTGWEPCYTTAPCFSADAVDPCNTGDDATCGQITCQRSCSPYELCCATDGLQSCV